MVDHAGVPRLLHAQVRRQGRHALLPAEHGPEEWTKGMHPEIPEHETLANPYTYRDDVSAWKDSE